MTLTPEDRARIEAEEAYRQQLKAQAAAKRRNGCAAIGCGIVAVPVVAVLGFAIYGSTLPDVPSSTSRQVEFKMNCERILKAQLKAPSTAKISDAFSDGILSTVSGYAWDGTVDAQNSFGAQIRTAFRCQGPVDAPTITMN